MNAHLDRIESPIGPIRFAVNEAGALLGLKFLDGQYPLNLEEELTRDGFALHEASGYTTEAASQLNEYFIGKRQHFDLPLALRGTAFQVAVWQGLTRIPYGQTWTYAQLAGAIGRPGAARAVGGANSANRIPLVIPCHRVIGTDGSLTGFAGGTHLKTRLLAFETAHGTFIERGTTALRQAG